MASGSQTETRHNQILKDIRDQIVDGRLQPGQQLPKEIDLASGYGVSRMTMNKVLTQLAQEGYVTRRRRSGTFVARARMQSAVLEINNIPEEVAALGRNYRWSLLSRQKRHLDQADRHMLGILRTVVDEDVLFVEGMHFADDKPFCFEARAINLAVAPSASEQYFVLISPGTWLLRTMPWSTARHQVRAVNAGIRDAKSLEVAVGAACLEILRKTQIEASWVTYARLLYPGQDHQLIAEFGPSSAAEAMAAI